MAAFAKGNAAAVFLGIAVSRKTLLCQVAFIAAHASADSPSGDLRWPLPSLETAPQWLRSRALDIHGRRLELGTPEEESVKDAAARTLIEEQMNELCANGFQGEYKSEDAVKTLEDFVGGKSILYASLKKAETQDEIPAKMQEEANSNQAAIFPKVFPIFLSFFCLWFYLQCCCWTWCCTRCRCCKKERQASIRCKFIVALIVFGLFIGMIASASVAAAGYSKVQNGVANFGCLAADTTNLTLFGDSTPTDGTGFIGIIPLVNVFEDMKLSLRDGSRFVTQMNAVIASTEGIDAATSMASKSLQLLSTVLKANTRPMLASEDLYHKCHLCGILQPIVDTAATAVKEGAGSALTAFRGEMEKQLGTEARKIFEDLLAGAVTPLSEMKLLFRDTLTDMLKSEGLVVMQEQTQGNTAPAGFLVAAIVVWAILVGLCGTCTLAFCVTAGKLQERGNDEGTNMDRQEMKDQMKKTIFKFGASSHRCACCTWCCGCYYIIPVFFLAGLLLTVVYPLADICLILNDMDGEKVEPMFRGLGMNTSGDETIMMQGIVDACFSESPPANGSRLTDILFVTDEDGKKLTVGEQIDQTVKAPIRATLDLMGSADIGEKLATSDPILKLRTTLKNTPVDGTILPVTDQIKNAELYQALKDDTRGTGFGVSVGLVTVSMSCADPAALDGVSILGLKTFSDRLDGLGTPIASETVSASCTSATKVDCTSSSQLTLCLAGNNYIELKKKLFGKVYRCDVFKSTTNANLECMPDTANARWKWSLDTKEYGCGKFDVNGVFQTETTVVTCTLPEFVAYLAKWDTYINTVFTNVDAALPYVSEAITVKMKGMAEEFLIGPIDTVMDGTDCRFLSRTFGNLVNGLCFQLGVGFIQIGNGYAYAAYSTLAMVVIMYYSWRYSVDNFNSAGRILDKE